MFDAIVLRNRNRLQDMVDQIAQQRSLCVVHLIPASLIRSSIRWSWPVNQLDRWLDKLFSIRIGWGGQELMDRTACGDTFNTVRTFFYWLGMKTPDVLVAVSICVWITGKYIGRYILCQVPLVLGIF